VEVGDGSSVEDGAGGVKGIAVGVGESSVETSAVAVAGGSGVEDGKLQATVARTHTTTASSTCSVCLWVSGSLRRDN
jgi:hypothetical protein